MNISVVLAEAQVPEAIALFQPHWEESVASYADGGPFFLQPAAVTLHREWAGFPTEAETELQSVAAYIRTRPALSLLAWHCYRLLFEHTDYPNTAQWPLLTGVFGRQAGVFYLLVAMAMLPLLRAAHERMGVPASYTQDAGVQISSFADNYRRMTGGELGICLKQIYWLRHHTAGRLFHIGRFQYMIAKYGGLATVYRHRLSGRVLALAPEGLRYDAAGYMVAKDNDAPGTWEATINRDGAAIAGFLISPYGHAVRRQIRLNAAAWECVLQKGDYTLDMHIPAGGRMLPEYCFASLRQAPAFFAQYFPDQPCNNISCTSWIFNNQFEKIRLSSTNLVDLQRELYLVPARPDKNFGLWFIFLQDQFDPATLPRDTSLRRGVADFLAAGNTWRGGSMFILTEHLAHLGTRYYRSRWDEEAAIPDADLASAVTDTAG